MRRLFNSDRRKVAARMGSWFARPFLVICVFLLAVTGTKAQTVLLGDQTIESNLDNNAKGLAEAFPETATTSGQVGSINLFLDESSNAGKIYIGIYSDSSGHPGTLLTQGSATQFALGTWNSITVGSVSLNAGTPYWIAILGTTSGEPQFRDRTTSSCQSQTSSQSTLTALPSSWSTGKTWGTCYISAYAVTNTLAATVLIGDQAVEASLDKNPAGRAEAFPAPANSTGTVGAIALYLDSTSGTGPVYVGLYANNNGHPGTLLGQGSTTSPVAGDWNQIAIAPSGVTAGQQYWIAVLGTQSTSPYFRDRQTTACHSETTPQNTLTSLPATWTTGTVWNTCYISAYGLPATGTSPVLSVTPTSLSFSATQGGANPGSSSVSVSNTGSGSLTFTASSDQSWLSVSPASGTAPATLQVSAAVGSLTAGTYTGHVTVTASGAQGSPVTVTVTFTVASPPPVLSVTPTSLSFSATQGGSNPAPSSATISNTGGGTLGFTASSDQSWLSVSPASGTAPATLQVSATVGSLAAGTYTGHVTVTAAGVQGSPATVTVTFTVGSPPPVLSVTPTSLSFSAIQAGANPASSSVSVSNTGGGTLSFTASSDQSWLSVSPASGTAPATLQVSAAVGSLTAGTYTGHVTVTASGAQGSPATVTVTFTVGSPPPVLSVTPASLSFTATQGGADPAPSSASVSNSGGGTFSFTASSDQSWLSVSPASGSAPATLQVSATLGSLAAGTYTGHVTVTASGAQGSPVTVTVTFTVGAPPAVLSVAPTGLSFSATQGGSDPAPSSVTVSNAGGGTLGFTTSSDQSWLLVSPASGTAPATLQVSATVAGLAPGSYTGHVTVDAPGVVGSPATVTVVLMVVPAGVIVGQVLSDVTGLPLPGASVQIAGQTASTASDSNGRYSTPANSSHLFLTISVAGNPAAQIPTMLTVEREVFVQPGVGTVPVDARLTPIGSPVSVDSSGGVLGSGVITVTVPAGGVSSATMFHLTPLSPQGLPGLLPLGWSPVAAFDVRSDTSTATPLTANFSQLPSISLSLVTYDYNVHAWTVVTPNLTVSNGSLSIPLPSTGDYALVATDPGNTSIQVPSAGQPLTGVAMVLLPSGAASSGSLNPPTVPPSGGTSMASLSVQSPTPLPSGTVVQSALTEKYTLKTGAVVEDPVRYEDILMYQIPAPSGAAVAANFPVTPSQTFSLDQFSSGDVHLDILSGREAVRGQTGGSDAVVVQSGDATLSVAAGSLPQDTAIAVSPESPNDFLPSTATLIPLAEYNLDFSGQTLNAPAELSVGVGSASPGDNILIALVQYVGGVPWLVAVSQAQVTASNIVSQSTPGLPGITQGGDYVFYKLTAPTGFVAGNVSASSGPTAAMVQTNTLPFVVFAPATGGFTVPSLAGPVVATATVPSTALAGTQSAQVTAGQTATANIAVVGQVEAASVTPPNGAVGVPLTAEIDITAANAFNPATVTSSSVTLSQSGQGGSPVGLRFVFSQGGTALAVFPVTALQPSTQYTLQASGLASSVGGLISVPTVSFTTTAVTPPSYNTDALVFSMPDSNGNVQINAPANSFPPGSTILIVDQTNGVVLSLTVGNDGSVSGQMPATIDDVLTVTLTDPQGNKTTFSRTQFVGSDGSVAVGSNGGTVTGPNGLAMIIPAGALDKGTVFSIQSLDQSAFPQLPNWQGVNFGSGMQINAPSMPAFHKEVKLVYPVPASAPSGAFYYVYRQLKDQNNNILLDTIDHAFVQGQGAAAQVVTASPPFCGYQDSYGSFQSVATASFLPSASAFIQTFMMWDFDPNQPGTASPGLIAGRLLRTVPPGPGQTDPTYVPVGGAVVSLNGDPLNDVATTDATCGTFTIFDPRVGGGSRTVTTTDPATSQPFTATVDEVNGVQADDATYAVTAGLESEYRDIGRVTITLPSLTPPPPPPQINISLYTVDQSGNRQPISGIVQQGASVMAAFSSTLTVVGATINGSPFSSVVTDIPPGQPVPGLNYYRLNDALPTGTTGVYTIVVTAEPALGGTPVTTSQGFLVVAAGGGNTVATAGQPPLVVSSTPQNNAQDVPVTTFPEVTFSEPVTKVPGNVTLVDAQGNSVPVVLIGVRSDGTVTSSIVATDAITSLTLQPLASLKFSEAYTLTLTSNILGLGQDSSNNPIPLATYALTFTTFGPAALGGSSTPAASTRAVVVGQDAYVGERLSDTISGLDALDISDPSQPKDLGVQQSFDGIVTDAAGLESSPVTRCLVAALPGQTCQQQSAGGPLVALSATQGPTENLIPSNIYVYDVSGMPQQPPVRVAAVSATTSATSDGSVQRMVMDGQYIYTVTFNKGLQVIDVQQAVSDYQQADPTSFGQALTTDGEGFALDAVVNTIPLPVTVGSGAGATTAQASMSDLKVANIAGQTLIVATGRLPLVVADPQVGVQYPGPDSAGDGGLNQAILTSADGTYQFQLGRAVALGTVSTTDSQGNSSSEPVAVLVGTGTASGQPVSLLVVVNMTVPTSPVLQGFLSLGSVGADDVILNGNLALVATGTNVLIVNIAQPASPFLAGQITGTFGTGLALTDSGILLGASPNSAYGGLHTAAIGTVPVVQDVFPVLARLDQNSKSLDPIAISYAVTGPVLPGTTGELDLTRDGQVVDAVPLGPIQVGGGTTTIPSGLLLNAPLTDVSITVSSGGQTTRPFDLTIQNAANSSTQQFLPSSPAATFTTLTPNEAVSGSAALKVTITGSGMDQISQVFVLGLDGSWTSVSTTSNSSASATVTIPASLLTGPGFLELSPTQDVQYAVGFMVFASGLPVLSTSQSFGIASVVPANIGAGGTIQVTGGPFTSGMNLVLGRSNTPGVVLSTTYVSSTELDADLPGYIGAQDLFVSVMAADGSSLSAPVSLYSTYPFIEVDSSTDIPPDDPFSVVSATGLVWNGQNQTITLQGAGLQPGMQVVFTTSQGTYSATTAAVPPSADPVDPMGVPTSSWLSSVLVKVPDQVTHMPTFAWLLKLILGGQTVSTSPPANQQPQVDYNVFLGGLSGFVVYFDQAAQNIMVLQQRGRTFVGPVLQQGNPNYVELTKDQLTWTITNNPTPQADKIPSVLQEIAGPPEVSNPDPAALYLRGVHLTPNQPVVVHLVAKYSTPASNLVFQRDLNINVIGGNLTGHTDDDGILNTVGDQFGIPPQFLYSQAHYEGGFGSKNATNFRYEPMTVDFLNFSGDDPSATEEPSGQRYVSDPFLSPYVINGTALSNSSTPQSATFVNAAVAGTPSTLGPSFSITGPIMAMTGTPGNPGTAVKRLMVTLTDANGNQENIQQVPSSPYTWVKGGPHCISSNPCVPAPTYFGIQTPPFIGTGPNLAPVGNQYALDYVAGQLTFGRQLQPGETLTVMYYPVSENQVPVTGSASAANLVGVKAGFPQLKFNPGESIADWAASNLNSQATDYQYGNFLTGTSSEKAWLFTATGRSGAHAAPVAPLDGRFNGATAQFFASASYGIIQVLARTLVDGTYGPTLRSALNNKTLFPTGTLFDSLSSSSSTALTSGLSLGAAYTQVSLPLIDTSPNTNGKNLRPHTCGIPNAQTSICTTNGWEGMWSSAFHLYNAGSTATHYSGQINDIVVFGMGHEPH